MLFLEDEFVVLHIFLGIDLEVSPQFVQIEAVLVAALLPAEEELAEFRRAEGRSDHSFLINVLVY